MLTQYNFECISILKMVVLFCMANKWLDHDLFALFEMRKEDVDPTFLIKEEIHKIADKEISIARLKRGRDIYVLFFTGLAYTDVEKLKRIEISVGVDNELWIFTDRLKTKVKSCVSLLPASIKIIKEYEKDIKKSSMIFGLMEYIMDTNNLQFLWSALREAASPESASG